MLVGWWVGGWVCMWVWWVGVYVGMLVRAHVWVGGCSTQLLLTTRLLLVSSIDRTLLQLLTSSGAANTANTVPRADAGGGAGVGEDFGVGAARRTYLERFGGRRNQEQGGKRVADFLLLNFGV